MKKGQNYDFDIITNEIQNHFDGISQDPLSDIKTKMKKPKVQERLKT